MADWQSEKHSPEGCPGCKPVVFDPATGKVEERLTALADKAWGSTTPEERRAWHRVTCLNSHDLIDVNLAKSVAAKIQSELTKGALQ